VVTEGTDDLEKWRLREVSASGSGAERIVMAARLLHGTCAGKEARARNSSVEVAAVGDEGQPVFTAVAGRSF